MLSTVYCCCCLCKKHHSNFTEVRYKKRFENKKICDECQNKLDKSRNNRNQTLLPLKYWSVIVPQPIREWFVRCPKSDKVTGTNVFLPKIDKDLLQRFMQILNGFDEYSFFFSSPEASQMLEIKPIFVTKELKLDSEIYFLPFFDGTNILVTEKIIISNMNLNLNATKILQNNFTAKKLIGYARLIEIYSSQIPPAIFFSLLTRRVTVLKCVKFTMAPIKFSNIIKNLSNLETLILNDTNIEFDNLWIKNLLDKCKNLTHFEISIHRITMVSNDNLPLYVEVNMDNYKQIFLAIDDIELRQKLSNFWITINGPNENGLYISGKIL